MPLVRTPALLVNLMRYTRSHANAGFSNNRHSYLDHLSCMPNSRMKYEWNKQALHLIAKLALERISGKPFILTLCSLRRSSRKK